MDKIIGIDLGTTNSVVAVVEDGRARILADADGERLIPSVVGISPDGSLLVGAEALRQYVVYPEATALSVKRRMGTEHKIHLNDKVFTPPEVSALVLRKVRQVAESHLGSVSKAVITVPAYFSDAQRQATKDAGELAGLEVVRIINEPTAAALVYTMNSDVTERVMVYDLGGGTFDVSIVEIAGDVTEVLASHGNNMLGGDDFDRLLRNHLVLEFERTQGVDLRNDPVALARLSRIAERTKIELSSHGFVEVREEFLARRGSEPLHLATTVTREAFESMIEPMIDATIQSVERALEDARLGAADIDRVILAGGSTRIPLVHEKLEQRLGATIHDGIDPDLCVAMGAAYQGAVIGGEQIDSILVDVTPYSLGVATIAEHPLHGIIPHIFSPVIPRNTVVPVSRSRVYSNPFDNMDRIGIEVFQGEQQDVRENIEIGLLWIEDLPPMPAHTMKIDVHFDFDVNGILQVTAHDQVTGSKQTATFTSANSSISETQKHDIREKLDEIWEEYQQASVIASRPASGEPAPDRSERLPGRERELYHRAEQLLPSITSSAEADELRELLEELLRAAESGASEDLEKATAALEDVLYYLRR